MYGLTALSYSIQNYGRLCCWPATPNAEPKRGSGSYPQLLATVRPYCRGTIIWGLSTRTIRTVGAKVANCDTMHFMEMVVGGGMCPLQLKPSMAAWSHQVSHEYVCEGLVVMLGVLVPGAWVLGQDVAPTHNQYISDLGQLILQLSLQFECLS